MNVKKSAQNSKDSTPSSFRPKRLLEEVKAEVGRITWTSKEELRVYTQIVIGTTFGLGIGIFITDLLIQNIISGLENILMIIIG